MKIYYADMEGFMDRQGRKKGRSGSRESDFAYSLLYYGLRQEYQIEMPSVSADEAGRPYFPERPELSFSISHSRGRILCAISDTTRLGADIESRERRVPPELIQRLTTEREREDFDFLELWVLRESFFKLTGEGELRTLFFSKSGGEIVPPNPSVMCRVYRYQDIIAAVSSYKSCFPEKLVLVPPELLII